MPTRVGAGDSDIGSWGVPLTRRVVVQAAADLDVLDAKLVLVAVHVEPNEKQLQSTLVRPMTPHNNPENNATSLYTILQSIVRRAAK